MLGLQFQNAAVARFPDAIRELAIYALAQGTFGFFQAALNFMPQLSNVYARSPTGRRRSQWFALEISAVLAILILGLATTDPGTRLISFAYGIDPALTSRITQYLILLSPLLFINGQRHYFSGLLIQARLTGSVTLLNIGHLSAVLTILWTGYQAGWGVVATLVSAQVGAALLHLIAIVLTTRWRYTPPVEQEHDELKIMELIRFFVPMSTTGIMFALSRPVLYGFVSRTPDALVSIAALRIAFDFSMMFQQVANQFRHFFVTFGLDDLETKRLFMILVGGGTTGLMLALAITPASGILLGTVMGLGDPVKALAVDVIRIMCLLPGIIVARNYYHGILMVQRRTTGMAAGGILRVVAIYIAAQTLFGIGWLDHRSAAWILLAGFGVETASVMFAARRRDY